MNTLGRLFSVTDHSCSSMGPKSRRSLLNRDARDGVHVWRPRIMLGLDVNSDRTMCSVKELFFFANCSFKDTILSFLLPPQLIN